MVECPLCMSMIDRIEQFAAGPEFDPPLLQIFLSLTARGLDLCGGNRYVKIEYSCKPDVESCITSILSVS